MPRLNALQFVRAGVTEGLSGRQAYARMQAEAGRLSEETGLRWTGVARDIFFRMYSGTVSARQNVIEAINAPKDVPGGGLSIPSRPSTVASGYLHAGVAFTRPIGSVDIERSIHLVRSNSLLTPAQVEDEIRQQIESSAQEGHGTFAGFTIEGVTFSGVETLVQGAWS